MRKLNEYFFGEAEICLSEWLWFYGGMILITVIAGVAVVPAWIQMMGS
jgi:hypothetical protein